MYTTMVTVIVSFYPINVLLLVNWMVTTNGDSLNLGLVSNSSPQKITPSAFLMTDNIIKFLQNSCSKRLSNKTANGSRYVRYWPNRGEVNLVPRSRAAIVLARYFEIAQNLVFFRVFLLCLFYKPVACQEKKISFSQSPLDPWRLVKRIWDEIAEVFVCQLRFSCVQTLPWFCTGPEGTFQLN